VCENQDLPELKAGDAGAPRPVREGVIIAPTRWRGDVEAIRGLQRV